MRSWFVSIVRFRFYFELVNGFFVGTRGSEVRNVAILLHCISSRFVKDSRMTLSRYLVWFVGDSHIVWLERFVASTEVALWIIIQEGLKFRKQQGNQK